MYISRVVAFLITSIIILLILYSIVITFYPRISLKDYTVPLNTVYLDTGDLLVLSGTSRSERVCRFFSNSRYSHICFLARLKDSLYIIESSIGDDYVDGVRIVPFEKFINRWKDRRSRDYSTSIGVICKLNTMFHKRPEISKVLDVFNDYIGTGFDTFMLSWCVSNIIDLGDPSVVFCSQFITMLNRRLEIDLVERDIDVSYSPEDFLHSSRVDVNYNYIDVIL